MGCQSIGTKSTSRIESKPAESENKSTKGHKWNIMNLVSGTAIADFKTDGKYFFTKFTVFTKY